jgi:hypothetical protein
MQLVGGVVSNLERMLQSGAPASFAALILELVEIETSHIVCIKAGRDARNCTRNECIDLLDGQ